MEFSMIFYVYIFVYGCLSTFLTGSAARKDLGQSTYLISCVLSQLVFIGGRKTG